MKRAIKNRLKSMARYGFELAQRLGVDILPHHFYSQIPDIGQLKRDDYWRAPSSMHGVSGSEIEGQLDFAGSCISTKLTSEFSTLDIHQKAIR